MLFISGCTAVNTPAEAADVLTQAKVTLDRIKRIVEAEGGEPSDVVRVVVYVTDMESFRPLISKFDVLMEEVFKDQYPTSTLVASPGLARPGLKIEIEATAML
jgi:2-iminobutanoate/2-iminopropanoate deaminase